MVGDAQDMLSRLKAALPVGWFVNPTPMLDAVLTGVGDAWSWCYGLLQYVVQQTRLATASGIYLDMIASDFFGQRLQRRGEPDDAFRQRIKNEIFRQCGTRDAITSVLQDLTGRPPIVFEPTQPRDTGAYSTRSGSPLGLAYGLSGGWGSLEMPFQAFVTAFRPAESGIPLYGGWGTRAGGYGKGALAYANLAMSQGQVADSDIYCAVSSILPTASTAWTRISN